MRGEESYSFTNKNGNFVNIQVLQCGTCHDARTIRYTHFLAAINFIFEYFCPSWNTDTRLQKILILKKIKF